MGFVKKVSYLLSTVTVLFHCLWNKGVETQGGLDQTHFLGTGLGPRPRFGDKLSRRR